MQGTYQKFPLLNMVPLNMLSSQALAVAHWFKNSLETFFKAIFRTDLGQVCKFWGVYLAPEPLKLTSFHGQIDQ